MAASLAKVPVSLKELYESDDRDYVLVVVEVVERTIAEREEAMRNA